MNLRTLSELVEEMGQWMPLSAQALLAHKLLKLITSSMDPEYLKVFQESGGPSAFISACRLKSGLPHVDSDVNINDTDLATFCNRWMNVTEFKNPETGEFQPLTPDMHSIRYTMVKELQALAQAQRESQ